jgi:hypothetical protein
MLIPTDKTELAGRSRVAASSVLDTVAGRDLLGTNGS